MIPTFDFVTSSTTFSCLFFTEQRFWTKPNQSNFDSTFIFFINSCMNYFKFLIPINYRQQTLECFSLLFKKIWALGLPTVLRKKIYNESVPKKMIKQNYISIWVNQFIGIDRYTLKETIRFGFQSNCVPLLTDFT